MRNKVILAIMLLIALTYIAWANTSGWTVGDAATTLAKDTSTVKFDTQSLKITNGDATQAFARQTVTTAAGEDYVFNGWHYGAATVNGASQLVDVDTTAALGVTATQAGISASTWKEINLCFEAADASTTVDLGTGSVTNAEIGYWDEVSILSTPLTQGGCEAADGNTLPTGWSDTGTPDADETQTDTADKHSGSSSILLSSADTDEGATQNVTVVSGRYYTISFWEKNNAQDIDVTLSGATTKTIDATGDNTWTKHSFTFLTSSTTLTVNLISGTAAQSGWFDDIAVIILDQVDASTATPTNRRLILP